MKLTYAGIRLVFTIDIYSIYLLLLFGVYPVLWCCAYGTNDYSTVVIVICHASFVIQAILLYVSMMREVLTSSETMMVPVVGTLEDQECIILRRARISTHVIITIWCKAVTMRMCVVGRRM